MATVTVVWSSSYQRFGRAFAGGLGLMEVDFLYFQDSVTCLNVPFFLSPRSFLCVCFEIFLLHLIYSVLSISAVQQSDPVIHI